MFLSEYGMVDIDAFYQIFICKDQLEHKIMGNPIVISFFLLFSNLLKQKIFPILCGPLRKTLRPSAVKKNNCTSNNLTIIAP